MQEVPHLHEVCSVTRAEDAEALVSPAQQVGPCSPGMTFEEDSAGELKSTRLFVKT